MSKPESNDLRRSRTTGLPDESGGVPPDLAAESEVSRLSSSGFSADAALVDLTAEIVDDQHRRHQNGRLPDAEEYFEMFPELYRQPEHAVDVICNEFLLRHNDLLHRTRSGDVEGAGESGADETMAEYLRRFPEHSKSLERQFQYYKVLDLQSHSASSLTGGRITAEIAPVRESDLIARRFEVRGKVGSGAHSNVYRGWDRQLKRYVAIKLSRAGIRPDSRYFRRFAREAESTARLQHPGIIEVYEFGIHDGNRPFIVGQLLNGGTLEERIDDGERTFQDSARWVMEICKAVGFAHEQGVIHRDIKPANVLFKDDGSLCLTDFGLAAISEAELTLTRQGDMLGTPAYMSPEQSRGVQDIGPATDIYSLGVVLYHLLCRRLPFNGSSAGIIHQTMHDDPLSPRQLDPAIPLDLETICLKAMSKRPRGRYATAAEMAADLQRFLNREPVLARRIGFAGRLAMWGRRNPALCATIAAFTLLLVTVLITGFRRLADERDRLRLQRDAANSNLMDSLVNNVETMIRSKPVGWYEDAFASIQQAAELDVPGKDLSRLRELMIELLVDTTSRFELESELDLCHPNPSASISAVSNVSSAGVYLVGFTDGTIYAIDSIENRKLGRLVGPEEEIEELQVRPDAGLVTGLSDDEIWFWDLDSFFQQKSGGEDVVVEGLARMRASSFAWSSDGTRLAVSPPHGSVRVYSPGKAPVVGHDIKSLSSIEIDTNGRPAACIAFSEDILAAGFDDGTIGSWNPSSGSLIGAYTRNPDKVVSIQIFGNRICWTNKVSYRVGRWQPGLGNENSEPFPGAVVRVGSLNGSCLIACEDGTLCLYSHFGSAGFIAKSDGVGEIRSFGVDDAGVVAGYADGVVRRWGVASSEVAVARNLRHGLAHRSDGEFITPDGSFSSSQFPHIEERRVGSRFFSGIEAGLYTGLICSDVYGVVHLNDGTGETRSSSHDDGRENGAMISVSEDSPTYVTYGSGSSIDVCEFETLSPVYTFELPRGKPREAVLSSSFLVVAGTEGVFRWNLNDDSPRATVFVTTQPDSGTQVIALKGDQLAVGGESQPVEIRDVGTGALIRELPDSTGAMQLEYSVNGEQLIGLISGKVVATWDIGSGELEQSFNLNSPVAGITLDPLGRFLIARVDQFAQAISPEIYTLEDGTQIGSFDRVYFDGPCTFSHDGEKIWFSMPGGILEYERAELTAALERFESGRNAGLSVKIPLSYQFMIKTGHTFDAWSSAVSPDASLVASTGFDRQVIVRDGETFAIRNVLSAHREDVWGCAFSPDGKLLATGSELERRGEVIVWDLETGKPDKRIFFSTRLISSLSFHPDAPLLAISSFDGSASIANYETGRVVQELIPAGGSRTMEITFSPDGRSLVAARTSGGIAVWEIDTEAARPASGEVLIADPGERVWTVQFDADGRHLYSGSESGRIRIYEFPSCRLLVSMRTSTSSIRKIALDEDGGMLAFSAYVNSPNSAGQIWDLTTLRERLAREGLDW